MQFDFIIDFHLNFQLNLYHLYQRVHGWPLPWPLVAYGKVFGDILRRAHFCCLPTANMKIHLPFFHNLHLLSMVRASGDILWNRCIVSCVIILCNGCHLVILSFGEMTGLTDAKCKHINQILSS